MSGKTLRLAIIVGSVREGRFGPIVANWITEQAQQHGTFKVHLVDLAEVEAYRSCSDPSHRRSRPPTPGRLRWPSSPRHSTMQTHSSS